MMQLTDYEQEFLQRWQPEKDLDEWVSYLDRANIHWESHLEWNAPRATECFHPSAIARYFTSQPCATYLWHQLMGSPSKKTLGRNIRKRADMGTAIHGLMDYYIGTMAQHKGFEYRCEAPAINRELMIEGHVDAITWWPFRQPIIWDWKSIASTAFKKVKLPHPVYVHQVNTYMGVLGIPVCVIMYVIKDTTDFFPCIVHFNQDMWEQTTEVLNDVITNSANPPAKTTGSYCKQCGFAYDCFDDIGKSA